MKFKLFLSIPFALILALVLALLPAPVYAQLSIISVLPGQVVNDVATTITVTGTDFIDGSVVLLDGYGALATTFQNATVLTAVVPAGIGAGTYTVTVSTGADTVSCTDCLTVRKPRPAPSPTATTAPLPFVRPQFAIEDSKTIGDVRTNHEFKLNVAIWNAGTAAAYNVQAVFTSTDLIPLENGGVAALGTVGIGQTTRHHQQFLVTTQLYGPSVIALDMTLTYYDDQGTSYSDKFTLSIQASGGGWGVAAATATPTNVKNSQLVITGYSTSIETLQPGEQFTLTMTVQNVGNAPAQRVTMIVGGGSGGGSSDGTPQPGGVSGGSGEFTNFAPVGASNVQSLGDLAAGNAVQAVQNLIVNVSTNPGAYPMKVTFSYINEKNEVINDEQVITLLIYSLPNVDVSFYRPPDPFFVGQPGALPLQVVNLGKRLAVLGNIKIATAAGMIENGTGLIGSLDTGGYFTLDSVLIPEHPGTASLEITIEYVDDFNQARTITRTLTVDVAEAAIEMPLGPSMGEGEPGQELPAPGEETFLQKAWRFVLGLFGLDSAASSGSSPGEEPPLEEPMPGKPLGMLEVR